MIDWQQLPARVNSDPELRLSARAWTATLRIDVGESSHALHFDDGVLTSVEPTRPDAACDLFVSASEPTWRELLAPMPRPFFQDLTGAAIHHGVGLPQDPVAYAAYYPALRRLVQVMSGMAQERAK
jgi:hypothetical protein